MADTDVVNTSLALDLFDSNMGTLFHASIHVLPFLSTTGTVTNLTAVAGSFIVDENVRFTLSDTTRPTSALAAAFAALTANPSGSVNLNLPSHGSAPYSLAGHSDVALSAPLSSLQQTGGGADTISISTATHLAYPPLFLSPNVSTTAGLQFSITYDFIPAPEPASLTLLGAGLAALGAARRRGA